MVKRFVAVTLAVALFGAGLSILAQPIGAQQNAFPVSARFVNAMTNMDEINIYLNGSDKDQRIIENLAYGEVSASFELTAPASQIIVKAPVTFGFDQWLFNTVIPTPAGQELVIIVSDFVMIPTLVDTSAVSAGSARVRAIHAAAQAPAVDVVVNSLTVATNLAYGRATDAGEVPAGTYTVTLNAAGTTTVALTQDVTLEAGSINTVIVLGKPGSTERPLTLLVVPATPPAVPATPQASS